MRIKWHGVKYKGYDKENDIPIMEIELSKVYEGEVVATVPFLNYKYNLISCSSQFVVLLDDNTFKEVPISMCEKVDNIYLDD